jgi:hypothetical protein
LRDEVNNTRRAVRRRFRNKRKEYLEDKINELATSGRNKNCIEE